MFERILCVSRSSDGPTVGHIQLADQLIDAVVSWSENSLAQPEPEGVGDVQIMELMPQQLQKDLATVSRLTDYKALCAELADALNGHTSLYEGHESELVARARAALAQPEPVGPSDGEILSLMVKHNVAYLRDSKYDGPRYLRSRTEERQVFEVVRESLALYASPQPSPVPVAEDVLHEEILRLAAEEIGYEFTGQWFLTGGKGLTLETNPLELLNFAHAILARWGRPTIEPVPVSEGLPKPKDCDAEGRCWWFNPGVKASSNPHIALSSWRLTHMLASKPMGTHWRPHHALPVPGAEVG